MKSSRIPELDGLRGMAILLVLLYHYFAFAYTTTPWLKNSFALGWSGVDLFFVLSGFLIGGILLDAKESPAYFKTFYSRRVFRIMPLYYVWIAIYFVLAAFLGNPEKWSSIPIYVLFLQNSVKINHGALGTAWLSGLWSLAVEEQFYLVIPLAIRFLDRRRLQLFLWTAVFAAPLVRVLLHEHLKSHPAAPYMLTVCRADTLAIGVLMAIAWRNEVFKAKLVHYRAGISGVVFLLFAAVLYLAIWKPLPHSLTMDAWGFSAIAAFFAGLVATALMFPGGLWAAVCRWSFLAELGRVSYCLYVIHPVVNFACHKFLLHDMPRAHSWQTIGVTVLSAPLAYGLAILSWKFFEYPLLRRGHRYTY